MTVISGIGGVVNGASTIRNWKVSTQAAIQNYVASNTKGMQANLKGNLDWSGSYDAYGHTPSSMPGSALAFSGTIDGSNGCQGAAIVDSVEITINIESGEIIAHTVNFSGNGALTIGGASAVAPDTSSVNAFSSIGTKVQIAAPTATSPSYSDLEHIKTATIRISADNVAYVDSSTGGLVKRVKGNLNASVSFALNGKGANLANLNLVLPNTEKFVKVFVTSTAFWEFSAIRFESLSDVVVDREAAAIVGATLNGTFTGRWTGTAGALTEGSIKVPAGTTWWPAT